MEVSFKPNKNVGSTLVLFSTSSLGLSLGLRTIIWFLATFGDLGWGKAEGRRQEAEVGRVEVINSSFEFV